MKKLFLTPEIEFFKFNASVFMSGEDDNEFPGGEKDENGDIWSPII